MAKNECGFMSARHPKPDYYKLICNVYNAVYIHPETDVEYMIEGEISNWDKGMMKPNAPIIGYNVLRQDKDCRRQLLPTVKTQKAAVEYLQKIGVIV